MKYVRLRTASSLAFDVLIIVVCLYYASTLMSRSRVPFDAVSSGNGIVVSGILDQTACPDLRTGDVIATWKGNAVHVPEALEFLADYEPIGTAVDVSYVRNGTPHAAMVRTIRHYDLSYLVLILLIGVTSWLVGIYLLLRSQGQFEAAVLHWGLMSLGAVVVLAWEGIIPGRVFAYLSSALFFVSYIGVSAIFFFFTYLFPRRREGSLRLRAAGIILLSVCSLVPLLYHHERAVRLVSIDEYLAFQTWFDVFHLLLFLFIAGGIINFVISYIRAESSEERRKIQWLVFGFSTGPTPFILLTIIPTLIAPEYVVPEQYTLAFLIIIPLTFAISFVQYHLFDVEVVIQRTTAYGLVVASLLLVYLTLVGLIAWLIPSFVSETYAIAAVLVGLLFEPARRRVQRAVDRTFFRVRYSFREAARSYGEEIRHCLDIRELGDLLVKRIGGIIPVERLGLFLLHQPGNRLRVVSHYGFDRLEGKSLRFQVEKLQTALEQPVGVSARIERGIPHEPADEQVFGRWGMVLVLPILARDGGFLGFLVLGGRKSGARFTMEDVDLLRNIATQTGLAIDRMQLQRALILKQAEAEHLAELNELKSDFVSYVSHELRTPLTSIKLFTELLKEASLDDRERGFVATIEGESDRLNRMVSTILDSAEIEHGVKEFNRRKIDLVPVAAQSLSMMDYQLRNAGFTVEQCLPSAPLLVLADPDAVLQCLLNLITNAIKYSGEEKHLRVTAASQDGSAVCSVEDHGLGIPPDDAGRVFHRFFRGGARRSGKKGVGLGLPLVHHIMEAHGGRVELRSREGEGSCFTLVFPLHREEQP